MIETANSTGGPRKIAAALRGRAWLIVVLVLAACAHNLILDKRTAATPADIVGNNVNTSATRTFASAGTYNYHCNIRPGIAGVVVVRVTQGM